MIKWDILCRVFKIVPKGQYSDSDDNLASLIRDDEYLGQKLIIETWQERVMVVKR